MALLQAELPHDDILALHCYVKAQKTKVSPLLREVIHNYTQNPELILNVLQRRLARTMQQPREQAVKDTKPFRATSDEKLIEDFKSLADRLGFSFNALVKVVVEDIVYH